MKRADFVFINPEAKKLIPGLDWGDASAKNDWFNQGNLLVEKGIKAVFEDQRPTFRGQGYDINSIVTTVVQACTKHMAKIGELYIIGHGNATQGMRIHTNWLSHEGVMPGGEFRSAFMKLNPYADKESQIYLHACGAGSYKDGKLLEEIARLTGASVSGPRFITTPFNVLGHRLIDKIQRAPSSKHFNWSNIPK